MGQLSKQVTDTTAQKQLDDSIYGIEKKPFPYLLCVTNMLLHDIEVPNIYHMNSLKHNLLDYTDDDKYVKSIDDDIKDVILPERTPEEEEESWNRLCERIKKEYGDDLTCE